MKSQKLSAMLLCLGEPPVRFLFLCCCSLLMCIFICRSSLFCFCIFIWFPDSFTMSPALHLGFSDPWRPPPALSFTLTTFDCLFFFIYRKRYGFEWAFFTHRRLLPCAPSPTFLTQPAFIKASLGAGSFPLKFAGLQADPRSTNPARLFIWFFVIWFTAIHNLDIQKNSFLNSTKYYHELLVVKV